MLAQFVRYNIVGIANTLVGFCMIILFMLYGFTPHVSNGAGYAIGAILSYEINRKYTFGDKKRNMKQVTYFFMVVGVAYGVNVVTLSVLLDYWSPYFAQLGAAFTYTVSAFMLNFYFVFRTK